VIALRTLTKDEINCRACAPKSVSRCTADQKTTHQRHYEGPAEPGFRDRSGSDSQNASNRPEMAGILFMRTRQQIAWSVLLFLIAAVARGSAQTESPTSTENIIARMTQAEQDNHAHFQSYVVTRDYKLFDKAATVPASEVVADLTFVPPYLRSYAIRYTHGNSMGESIVRRMLEAEMAFAKDSGSTDISKSNYDFQFIHDEDMNGQHCYVLALLPRRRAKNLLRGSIWVDTNTYLIHRVEGEPVKSSSWWLRNVRIALQFGYIGEMWTQTSSESTADVRIVGQFKMISQDVSYQIDQPSPQRSSDQSAFFPGTQSEAPSQVSQ
jgi:hypothetical protein